MAWKCNKCGGEIEASVIKSYGVNYKLKKKSKYPEFVKNSAHGKSESIVDENGCYYFCVDCDNSTDDFDQPIESIAVWKEK